MQCTERKSNGATARRHDGKTAIRQYGDTAVRQYGDTVVRHYDATALKRRHNKQGVHVSQRQAVRELGLVLVRAEGGDDDDLEALAHDGLAALQVLLAVEFLVPRLVVRLEQLRPTELGEAPRRRGRVGIR